MSSSVSLNQYVEVMHTGVVRESDTLGLPPLSPWWTACVESLQPSAAAPSARTRTAPARRRPPEMIARFARDFTRIALFVADGVAAGTEREHARIRQPRLCRACQVYLINVCRGYCTDGQKPCERAVGAGRDGVGQDDE